MRHNVGKLDRAIRAALGIALLAFLFVSDAPGRWWGLIGLAPLLTAVVGYCPVYALFGISTCSARTETA